MQPRQRYCLIALISLAACTPAAYAQRYRTGRGVRVQTRSRDRGSERGFIVRVRAFGNNAGGQARGRSKLKGGYTGKKTGQITIKAERGPQFSAVFTHNTEYTVDHGQLSPSKVRALLGPGIPVELNWETSDEVGGRAVTALRIRTIEIDGVISKLGRRKFVVLAAPKTNAEEQSRPEITVRGRRGKRPNRRGDKPEPKPRKLALNTSNLTRFTLDGEPAKLNALRPTMAFDALVTDGGPRLVLELHARTDPKAEKGKRDKDAGDGGGKKTKKTRAERKG